MWASFHTMLAIFFTVEKSPITSFLHNFSRVSTQSKPNYARFWKGPRDFSTNTDRGRKELSNGYKRLEIWLASDLRFGHAQNSSNLQKDERTGWYKTIKWPIAKSWSQTHESMRNRTAILLVTNSRHFDQIESCSGSIYYHALSRIIVPINRRERLLI